MSARIQVSLRVNAGADRAFDVFVNEIGKWWRPNALFSFTPRSPGVLAFEPGPDGRLTETLPNGKVFEIGRITAWEPGVRLAFSWRQATFAPDQITHVDVRFEPVGDQTRVTVEHTGWETVPPEHVARHGFPDAIFLQRHGEWWQALLKSFKGRFGQTAHGAPGRPAQRADRTNGEQ
ncbi:MAG: SRPBCC family protein [Alphaproteobacteria bacterium]